MPYSNQNWAPKHWALLSMLLATLAVASCDAQEEKRTTKTPAQGTPSAATSAKRELATFGGGCFWCTEAVFELVKGVEKVESGYSGGSIPNPSYQAVCSGRTGHAEVIRMTFDPNVISYSDLLEIFWKTHDPTTLNRQGPDKGTQYRSVVFYHSEQQKETATAYKKQLNATKEFRKRPVVTEISVAPKFYPAETYHQNFFELNPRYGYCKTYVSPKIRKFNRLFKDKRKDRK